MGSTVLDIAPDVLDSECPVQNFLQGTLFQLVVATPSNHVFLALEVLELELSRGHVGSDVSLDVLTHRIHLAVVASLNLQRLRERLTGGRRVREQVQKALLCLPGDLVWALKRRVSASLFHCAELRAWISLQACCILAPPGGRGRAFICQLVSRGATSGRI